MAFIWAGTAWLLGLILASLVSFHVWQWCVLTGASILAAILFRKQRPFRNLFWLFAVFFLASAHWANQSTEINDSRATYYANINQEVQITGTIIEDPEAGDTSSRFVLKTERIWISSLNIQQEIGGTILVYASALEDVSFGQRIKVTGRLEYPPDEGDFSYRAYLARQGIYAWMPDAFIRSLGKGDVNPALELIHKVRGVALIEIQRLFPYPEAPLLSGILLGIESRIPDDLLQAYSRTGTTHIIAISGFNITILANLTIALFHRWLGRTRGLFMAGIVIILYSVMVGADAPVVRAALMGSLALLARHLGRRTHGLTSLTVAGVVMTLISPQSIYDVGFQLSFAATLGLILYAEPLRRLAVQSFSKHISKINAQKWGSITAELLLFTFAAQVTTLPIIVWHFHQLSTVSLITNALILPLQPLLMILSGIATIAGMIWHPLGQLLAWLAWPFSALTNQIVQAFAAIPSAVLITGDVKIYGLLAYYSLLLMLTTISTSTIRTRITSFLRAGASLPRLVLSTGSLITLGLSSLLVWHTVTHQADGLLHTFILDVGDGEAILIRSPSGGTILINGGASPVSLATELGEYLPYPDRRIDWLLLAGAQYSQLAGLRDIVTIAPIDQAFLGVLSGGSTYQKILDQLVEAGIPTISAQEGMNFDLGQGAILKVLSHGSNGLTLLLQYGSAHVLFPVGLSPPDIPRIWGNSDFADVTAVLLPDSGYEALNPDALLQHYNPQVLLISCEDRSPSSPIEQALHAAVPDRTILRTDLHGAIELATDGQHLWITTERESAKIELAIDR